MLYKNLPVNRLRNQLLDHFFALVSGLSGILASTYSRSRGLFTEFDVPYTTARHAGLKTDKFSHFNTLDIIFPAVPQNIGPAEKTADKPVPVAIHIHGGGFRIFSKNSHAVVAAMLADAGYIVFNINYRLAPQHPYPAALEDTIDAYNWITEEAVATLKSRSDIPESYKTISLDFSNFLMMGESAGANLVLALTLALKGHGEQTLISRIKSKKMPTLIVPMCGFLEPTTVDERFEKKLQKKNRKKPALRKWVFERMKIIQKAYVPDSIETGHLTGKHALASPLKYLKSLTEITACFPKTIIAVGTKDDVYDDSIELDETLAKLGIKTELWIFENEPHGFHIFFWRKKSREFWKKFKNELLELQKIEKKNPSFRLESNGH